MSSKKAQGISINTIIIAAIALIVLVVLVMVFTGNIGKWVGGVDSCINKGGECKASCVTETEQEITGTDCSKETTNNKCCIAMP